MREGSDPPTLQTKIPGVWTATSQELNLDYLPPKPSNHNYLVGFNNYRTTAKHPNVHSGQVQRYRTLLQESQPQQQYPLLPHQQQPPQQERRNSRTDPQVNQLTVMNHKCRCQRWTPGTPSPGTNAGARTTPTSTPLAQQSAWVA